MIRPSLNAEEGVRVGPGDGLGLAAAQCSPSQFHFFERLSLLVSDLSAHLALAFQNRPLEHTKRNHTRSSGRSDRKAFMILDAFPLLFLFLFLADPLIL